MTSGGVGPINHISSNREINFDNPSSTVISGGTLGHTNTSVDKTVKPQQHPHFNQTFISP